MALSFGRLVRECDFRQRGKDKKEVVPDRYSGGPRIESGAGAGIQEELKMKSRLGLLGPHE
jgi:hypothetical protein